MADADLSDDEIDDKFEPKVRTLCKSLRLTWHVCGQFDIRHANCNSNTALHFRSRSSQINLQVWYAKVMVVDNIPNVPGAKYDKLLGVLKKKFGAYGQVNSLFMVRPPTVLMTYTAFRIAAPGY